MIPKTIHMIWLGITTPRRPSWAISSGNEWARLNPDWNLVWHTTDRRLDEEYRPYWELARWPNLKADLLRLSILRSEGGVYVDADTWPVAPIDGWLLPVHRSSVVCANVVGHPDSWFLATHAHSEAMEQVKRRICLVTPQARLRPRIYAGRMFGDIKKDHPELMPEYPADFFTTGEPARDRELIRRGWDGESLGDVGPVKCLHFYACNQPNPRYGIYDDPVRGRHEYTGESTDAP